MEKKLLRKKTLSLFFVKVNEGAEIKKTLDTFLEKLMRATKNKQKNMAGIVFLSFEINLFFFEFFLFSEINYFSGNRQQSNAPAEQKKTHVFLVMRGPNLMRALILNRF